VRDAAFWPLFAFFEGVFGFFGAITGTGKVDYHDDDNYDPYGKRPPKKSALLATTFWFLSVLLCLAAGSAFILTDDYQYSAGASAVVLYMLGVRGMYVYRKWQFHVT
jgi:hypothetical protein